MLRLKRVVFAAVICISMASTATAEMSIASLGMFNPIDISADGSTVVGARGSSYTDMEAVRWTQTGGMVGMGHLPNATLRSSASGVSADGTVVVGYSGGSYGDRAFRWTQESGMVDLGSAATHPYNNSSASDISADGSVIVGHYSPVEFAPRVAYRWTQEDGMVQLAPDGFARDVSANGSVVVGQIYRYSHWEAFGWTQDGGIISLGKLPGENMQSMAASVSDDGSVIVGYSFTNYGNSGEAFRWTQESGMIGLGDLPGGKFDSFALDTSADGSVVVGYGNTENGEEAFVWDSTNGMRYLKDILIAGGVDLTGWSIQKARAISADGTTITGVGINPTNETVAFVATIPEPATMGLLSLGGLAMLCRRRRA